jgi:AMMECR1 domain-containing protein
MPPALNRVAGFFVTLHKTDDLRGCCGTILARRPLIEDISANALRAAYRDPRFIPLEREEREEVSLSMTVLSSLQPMSSTNEAELLSKVQPFEDGLLIEDARSGGAASLRPCYPCGALGRLFECRPGPVIAAASANSYGQGPKIRSNKLPNQAS